MPMKLKKLKKRLEVRISDYEKMCKNSSTRGTEYTKPGSMKK